MFTGRETRYHQLNAHVTTDTAEHKNVSVEVRDGIATVRTGARVVEQRSGAVKTWAHDPKHVTITFDDGVVWESHATTKPCGCG